MIIEQFIILDYKNKKTKSFKFHANANIIHSHENTSGKSCLLKSIFYALGIDIQKFPENWGYKNMLFKIYYNHNGERGYIVRHCTLFYVNGIKNSLSAKEYAEWLFKLLNITMKLPHKDKEVMMDAYASAPLSLFYIDQDNSWSGSLYKDTVNLSYYKDVPKEIFKNILNISNEEITKLKEKIIVLTSDNKKLQTQLKALTAIEDKFIFNTEIETTFNEDELKAEIDSYLKIASKLSNHIKSYKQKLYIKQIKLDALLLEKNETDIILKHLNKSYKDIESQCTQCNSHLTIEQSLKRMKLEHNKFEVIVYIDRLQKDIKKLEEEMIENQKQQLGLEKEYSSMLTIAEKAHNDITLNQYINSKVKNNTKDIYFNVTSDLDDQINNIQIEIKNTQKELKQKEKDSKNLSDNIEKDFIEYLSQMKIIFPNDEKGWDYKFLTFSPIKSSGAVLNETLFGLYMIYSKILLKHSKITLPFVIDSAIKDELDKKIISKFYKILEETLLSSSKQIFIAMLTDKKQYIDTKFNFIELKHKNILNKDGYDTIFENEFDMILRSIK